MTGTVFLQDANMTEMTKTIDSQTGAFSFDVSGKTAPYMLRAGSLYSMASGTGRANINPMTNLIVAQMGGFTNMSSMNAFFANPTKTGMNAMVANMAAAKLIVRQQMQPLMNRYGVADADPMSDPFTVGQGMDRMFDDVKMSIDSNGNITMMYSNGTTVYTGPMGNMAAGSMMTGNIMDPGSLTSSITVTPSMAMIQINQTVQFSANIAVTWSVVTANGGTITGTGLYTAPATQGLYLIKATSIADPTKSTTVNVQVGSMGMGM
ncbi:MAG: hypothetical protein FPO08_04810 [Geobacter sp.]|nr:MAG: hypothetical protein FPO08_04810 [Geobacter sp.]